MKDKYTFEKISLNKLDTNEYYSFPGKKLFTTMEWIDFVVEDSKVKPCIIRINRDHYLCGYFTGMSFRKFGVKIIASPFKGWSTPYMGFDLVHPEEKLSILPELIEYLYKSEKCLYIEVIDRDFNIEDSMKRNYHVIPIKTLELPIDMDDSSLFRQMKSDCRNFIRQFERRGATLEIAQPDDKFAEEYYQQLIEVFSKQGLIPTYSCEKVKILLRNLGNSENLLCLRVRDAEGKCIATSIFPAYGQYFYFWGGASYKAYQNYRPNEYMIWKAIQYWRARGCKFFDMVGVRDYKKKFGSHEVQYAKIIFTRFPILIFARNLAEKLFYLSRRWARRSFH